MKTLKSLRSKTYFFICIMSVFLALSTSFLTLSHPVNHPLVIGSLILHITVFTALITLFIDYTIFNRIRRLGEVITAILTKKDASSHILTTTTDDELTTIAGQINNLLDASRNCKELAEKRKKQYKSLVDDMPACIIRFLPDGTITFANEFFCKLIKTRKEDVFNKNVINWVPECERVRVKKSMLKVTCANPIVSGEIIYPPNIHTRWTVRGIFDSHSRLLEYQGIGSDITIDKLHDQGHYQEVVDELNTLKDKYLSLLEFNRG